MKRTITKRNKLAEEVHSFNVVMSHKLSTIVRSSFKLGEVEESKNGMGTLPFKSIDIEMAPKKILTFIEKMRNENPEDIEEERSTQDFYEAISRIKDNIKKYMKRNQA
jgi:uncharacterized UPF0160 family protein